MKMNLKAIAPAALALCFTLTGCFSENCEESHGHVANVRTGNPPVYVRMLANGDGRLKNGSAVKLFSFYYESHYELVDKSEPKGWGEDDAYLLALFYPTTEPRRTLKTETGSNQVYAWLVPNDFPDRGQLFNYLNLPDYPSSTPLLKMVDLGACQLIDPRLTNEIGSAESPANFSIPRSIPLHGTVKIKQHSWCHRDFFHTDVDLTGNDGLKIDGEYTSYDSRKFDLDSLLVGLFWRRPG